MLAIPRVADELGVASTAFPALGTGVDRLDVVECALQTVGVVNEHLTTHLDYSLQRVVFVVRNEARTLCEDTIDQSESG
jgi:O-acetyl-ADP-ribose deacetylase (regulator of RNase III)